jgi:hypothetical protein
MFNINNVVVNGNVITCNVDNDKYSLEFIMVIHYVYY